MTDPIPRWPSVRQTAGSALWALAGLILMFNLMMAIVWLVNSFRDPAATMGERLMAVGVPLLVYGLLPVVVGWPLLLPIAVLLGWGLAYLRQRYRRIGGPAALISAAKVFRVMLIGYPLVVLLAALALLVNAAR